MANNGGGRPTMSLVIRGLRSYGRSVDQRQIHIDMSVREGPTSAKGRSARAYFTDEELATLLSYLMGEELWERVIDAVTAERDKIREEIESGNLSQYEVSMLPYRKASRLRAAAIETLKEKSDG